MAPASKYILSALFPLFTAFAFSAIFGFSTSNGTFDLIQEFGKNKILPFGDGHGPLRTKYTGIEAVDRMLVVLVLFFAPVADLSNPALLLHSIAFTGAFGSAWILVVLESWRAGNSRKLFSFSSVFGIGAQLMTYAASTPLFLGLQLLFSDVSFQPTAKNIAIPSAIVKAIPAVFTAAYIVPTSAMLLSVPDRVTFDQKQILIALWQPWPAYVSFMLTLISFVPFSSSKPSSSGSLVSQQRQVRKSLRAVYTFALTHATLGHAVAWCISLATVVSPAIFSSEYLHALHPSGVFGLRNPFTTPADFKVGSVSEGIHIFLQWDYAIGSSAVLLWAVIAHVSALRKFRGQVGWGSFLFKIATSLALTGPVGTAVRLVWERDELVLEEGVLKNSSM